MTIPDRHVYDIVIAAPNAAVDSYYPLKVLSVGQVNRSDSALHTAGGKGNNMARAAVMLGGRVLSIGIVGGSSGQFICDELTREGIAYSVVWTDTETRHSITVPALEQHETTVVLESGKTTNPKAIAEFGAKVRADAHSAPFLTFNGSLPLGCPATLFADLIRDLKDNGVRIAIDTAGEPLRLAAQAGPSIIKVNVQEFQPVFVSDSDWDWGRVLPIAEQLAANGTDILVITDGARGAYVFPTGEGPYHVKTEVDSWISTAGAGDTFLAGMLLALGRGQRVTEAARFASAAAAANLQQIVCGFVNQGDVNAFLKRTLVEKL